MHFSEIFQVYTVKMKKKKTRISSAQKQILTMPKDKTVVV